MLDYNSKGYIGLFCGLQLFARVERPTVNFSIKFSANVLQHAIVSESSPLCVDAHPALVSLHQVNMSQLLHVACVSAGT